MQQVILTKVQQMSWEWIARCPSFAQMIPDLDSRIPNLGRRLALILGAHYDASDNSSLLTLASSRNGLWVEALIYATLFGNLLKRHHSSPGYLNFFVHR